MIMNLAKKNHNSKSSVTNSSSPRQKSCYVEDVKDPNSPRQKSCYVEEVTSLDIDDEPGEEKSPLQELFDKFEWALSEAMLSYRRQVEHALMGHLEALENVEAKHQLEVSKIRAENNMLRGMLKVEDPLNQLFQNVVFEKKGHSGSHPHRQKFGPAVASNSHQAPKSGVQKKQISDRFKSRLMPQNNLSGGSWQNFIAWVPTGSALDTPQPWKPLESQVGGPPSRGNMGFANVLPGMVGTSEGTPNDGDSEEEEELKYKVSEVWQASKQEIAELRKSSASRKHDAANLSPTSRAPPGGKFKKTSIDTIDDEFVFQAEGSQARCVIHPHSKKRTAWDLACMVLVLYDMVMIPMHVFSLPNKGFFLFMDWLARVFWTIDIGFSCCTGFITRDGDAIFDIRIIMLRYLKTWFLLDLVIVTTDWGEVAVERFASAKIFGRLSRSFRVIRVIRLLRLLRLQEVISSKSVLAVMWRRIPSDLVMLMMSILRLVAIVITISHFTGCLWYGVGSLDDSSTWAEDWKGKTVPDQYLVSLHWSISQFSGFTDIQPVNAAERIFAVLVSLMSFTAAAIIWSVLTAGLTQQQIIGGAQSRQLATLRTYLKQNFITSNLALRMQRSAQHAISGDLTQDAIELLPVVSEPLRVEMHFEMYSPVMSHHHFFAEYIKDGPQVMRRVCHYGMSTILLSIGDVVFTRGETPQEPKMYFVMKGMLEYSAKGEVTSLEKNSWVAEAVLWTHWTYKGNFTAANDAKIAVLDAKTFQDIVDRFKESVGMDPKLRAADYVALLNETEKVTDLLKLHC